MADLDHGRDIEGKLHHTHLQVLHVLAQALGVERAVKGHAALQQAVLGGHKDRVERAARQQAYRLVSLNGGKEIKRCKDSYKKFNSLWRKMAGRRGVSQLPVKAATASEHGALNINLEHKRSEPAW